MSRGIHKLFFSSTLLQQATSGWSMRLGDPAVSISSDGNYSIDVISLKSSRSPSACRFNRHIPRSIFIMMISGNCSLREETESFQMIRVNTSPPLSSRVLSEPNYHSDLPRGGDRPLVHVCTSPQYRHWIWQGSQGKLELAKGGRPRSLQSQHHRLPRRHMGLPLGRRDHLSRKPCLHCKRTRLSSPRCRSQRNRRACVLFGNCQDSGKGCRAVRGQDHLDGAWRTS